jgi:hypothetical protein
MKIGIIHCLDSANPNQEYWIDSFKSLFQNLGLELHIISNPSMVREGYYYIWRPSAGNFMGKYKNTSMVSSKLSLLAKEYEDAGAVLFPNSENLKYYENKIQILKTATERNIKIPDTFHFESIEEAENHIINIKFPVLFKHAYSCNSFGMMKADSAEEYKFCLRKIGGDISNYIIQKRINIVRDIRINFVEDQNILSYSRFLKINEISTASRFESRIDHFSVPFHSLNYAFNIGKEFSFPFGGIDFAWEAGSNIYKDIPYLLEISPIFDVNPMPFRPISNWQTFKRKWNYKKYYKQSILSAANLELSYVVNQYHLNCK